MLLKNKGKGEFRFMNKNLVENRELREEVISRIEVLEQVKNVLTLESTDFSTVKLAAEYYEVNEDAIKKTIERNKDELTEDGLRVYRQKEIKEMLEIVENTKKGLNVTFKIPSRGLTLIPKRALLRIGMLLRDSEVAKEVRSRLLDIIHDVEVNTDIVDNIVEEIRTEQDIRVDMIDAMTTGDYMKLQVLQTELLNIKNKRIDHLEGVITNSVTITESKARINKCVRQMAVKKYNFAFGLAWNEFYKFVNYKLGININGRKGKGLDRFTDDEINKIEIIAKSWLEENGTSIKFEL